MFAILAAMSLSRFAVATPPAVHDPPQIAIPFDDLPADSLLPPGETRMDVASKILRALDDAHLPPTFGFVHRVRIEEQPAAAVLDAWRPARQSRLVSYELDQRALEEFEADVNRNQPLLSSRMKDPEWHW
jgi:hypothetical protein